MTNRLDWEATERHYETGLDRGVFYPSEGPGEAWNGLQAVTEDPDSDNRAVHIDGRKIVNQRTPASFSGSISALTYSDGFESEAFTTRRPKPFGLSYRVLTGLGYQIHLVYNVLVAPSPVTREHNDDPNPFEWSFSTTPVIFPENRRGAHIVINADTAYPWTLEALEDILYGTVSTLPYLPTPLQIFDLFEANSMLIVVDNGDGTVTITGPDDAILDLGSFQVEVTWPSVQPAGPDTYSIYSL